MSLTVLECLGNFTRLHNESSREKIEILLDEELDLRTTKARCSLTGS